MTVKYQHGAGYHARFELTAKHDEAIREGGFPIRRGQWVYDPVTKRSGRFLNVNRYGVLNVAWHNEGDDFLSTSRRLHGWTKLHNIRVQEAREKERKEIINEHESSKTVLDRVKAVFRL